MIYFIWFHLYLSCQQIIIFFACTRAVVSGKNWNTASMKCIGPFFLFFIMALLFDYTHCSFSVLSKKKAKFDEDLIDLSSCRSSTIFDKTSRNSRRCDAVFFITDFPRNWSFRIFLLFFCFVGKDCNEVMEFQKNG